LATTGYVVSRQLATERTLIYFTPAQQDSLASWNEYEHC
jgi:hypothetical protein